VASDTGAAADASATDATAGADTASSSASADASPSPEPDPPASSGDEAQVCPNSFTGNTRVLLANGARVAISRLRAGQMVRATDPYTRVSGSHRIVRVIRHTGLHTMVAITLLGGAVLHATDHHSFWDATTRQFTNADALKPGDRLLDAGGQPIKIANTRTYRANLTAYNLTISGIHTYYVLAGRIPVLVHNVCLPGDGKPVPDGYTRVYRFHTLDDPTTLEPRLAQQPQSVQDEVLNSIKNPKTFAKLANKHMTVGGGPKSPFVSLTTDPAAAANTPDTWLSTIATGLPGDPEAQVAPNLSSFVVPTDRLIGPQAANVLSASEGEFLWLGNDLGKYLEESMPNPFNLLK
jgi:hypothetical protein